MSAFCLAWQRCLMMYHTLRWAVCITQFHDAIIGHLVPRVIAQWPFGAIRRGTRAPARLMRIFFTWGFRGPLQWTLSSL